MKIKITPFLLVFFTTYWLACQSNPEPSPPIVPISVDSVTDIADVATEEKALNNLSKVPEVQKINSYIDSFTNHKQGVGMLVLGKPTNANPFYDIAVGYNGEDRFETYQRFRVHYTTMDIQVFDMLNDTILSLAEWRKMQ